MSILPSRKSPRRTACAIAGPTGCGKLHPLRLLSTCRSISGPTERCPFLTLSRPSRLSGWRRFVADGGPIPAGEAQFFTDFGFRAAHFPTLRSLRGEKPAIRYRPKYSRRGVSRPRCAGLRNMHTRIKAEMRAIRVSAVKPPGRSGWARGSPKAAESGKDQPDG